METYEVLKLILQVASVVVFPIVAWQILQIISLKTKQSEIEAKLENKMNRHDASDLSQRLSSLESTVASLDKNMKTIHDDLRLVINTMITNNGNGNILNKHNSS